MSGEVAAKETLKLIVELDHRFPPKRLISDTHSTAVMHIGIRCDEIATDDKKPAGVAPAGFESLST